MGVNGVVLLVGEGAKNSPQLLQWLKDRGCRCQAVKSCEDACNLVSRTQFNLVLSDYELPDGTAFPLLVQLVGSPATLFFFAPVARGSLCVEMLDRGQRCIGKPVFLSDALTGALARVLDAAPESRGTEAIALDA
jgi:CheY-like chemotaxis protein